MSEQNEQNNDQNQGGENNQQQNSSKDHKNFLTVVEQIFSLIGPGADPSKGTKNAIFQNKVPNDQVSAVMEKLAGKRRDKAIEKFESDMDKLLDRYAEFQRESAKRLKAFQDAELAKEKEFTKEAQAVLAQVQDMGSYFGAYQKGLNALAKAPANNNNEGANNA